MLSCIHSSVRLFPDGSCVRVKPVGDCIIARLSRFFVLGVLCTHHNVFISCCALCSIGSIEGIVSLSCERSRSGCPVGANRVTIPPSETEARARAAEVRAGEATELIQLKLLYQLILDWELPFSAPAILATGSLSQFAGGMR